MKKYIGDKDFYRRMFAIMLPILLQSVVTNFVSMLDNIMVGRVGTEAMSGVAIVNQLMFVFNLCNFGGLAGAGIFTAQFYGKGDAEGVRRCMRMKAWIAAGILAIGLGTFIGLGETLMKLFIHEGEAGIDLALTLENGKNYLRVMLFQMPLFALVNVYSSTLRETGETKIPMRASFAAVGVNLVFNYILIYGKFGMPALGVTGAAIATVLSRVVEAAINVIGAGNRFKGVWKSLRVPLGLAKQIGIKGFPLLINELLWSSGMTTTVQTLSLLGVEVISAENISNTISNLFFCTFLSMGNTISIIVGQHLGAGRLEQAKDEDRKLTAFSLALCVAVMGIMIAFAPLFPRLYNTSDTVRSLATSFIIIAAIMIPCNGYTNCCFFTLRSGGSSWITFLYDSVYLWVLVIPVTRILVTFTSLPTVTIYAISYFIDIFKCIFGFFLVRRGKWVKNLVADESLNG